MSILPDSNIVKRDEKLLESKRPVIPDSGVSQTSFRDQIKALDELGLRLLLYENPLEPKPNVLLSHSGTMATLPGSNILKSFEKHPESPLPTIPYGSGGQTSCRDQLQSTDSLGLCLPLQENRFEPKHKIFLSHSGAQKSFVKQLCKDIERYDRYPFFDILRTSLSIGCDFPHAIFEAIGQCQVAVVVLSEDFFSRSKWPMLELSALVKRKSHDPSLIIMPVFLGLTREQCRARENQERWFPLWQDWAKDDRRIILEDWMVVFKVFGYINSITLRDGDRVKCREDIVDAVCKEVPPETWRDDSHVQGRSHMCKSIGEKIGGMESSKQNEVWFLGVYGVGGIGKSTACMTLCNHYFEEFHGQVCHVQFGDGDELHILRKILKGLTDIEHQQIDRLDLDECKGKLKNIKNQKIFLALDNVSKAYKIVQQAKLILRVGFAKGSIVIVTARSLGELQNLNLLGSECMPMPELEVEDAMSLFVQEAACNKSTNEQLIRHCVQLCYFDKGDGLTSHYHPLALRVLGSQLGCDPSQWLVKLDARDKFNLSRERSNEHPIFHILRSFDVLQDEDRLLFMDCALFAFQKAEWEDYNFFVNKDSHFQWLNMIHGDELKSRLSHLKEKSLIESTEEGDVGIGIHDLWREFSVMETEVGELKSRLWIYQMGSGSNIGGSIICNGAWEMAQRITLIHTGERVWSMHFLNHCSNLIALHLYHVDLEGKVLDLKGVCQLKSLKIHMEYHCEVRGLGLLMQLCWLEWDGEMPSNMAFIEEIGDLTNLQVLKLSSTKRDRKIEFPNLNNLSLLQLITFKRLCKGILISFDSTMFNLRELHLEDCTSLERCKGIGHLVKLEKLRISYCESLEALPNLQVFKNLKKLGIFNCPSIQELFGIGNLATLLELRICYCRNLRGVLDLSKLTNLQVLHLWKCSQIRAMLELSELINLQECWISINGIREISGLQKLTKLQIIKVDGWDPEGALNVDSLVNLKSLSITNCGGVDSLDGLSKVTGLQSIHLENCEFKDVACLKDMVGLCKIYIWSCNSLKSFPDMHKATRLEVLRIDSCDNLQVWEDLSQERASLSEGIGVVFRSGQTFSNLQNLDLIYVLFKGIPDLSNFPKLIWLNIFECHGLVNLTMSEPLIQLENFDVENCSSLTTIPSLIGCKHLECVHIRGSNVILSEKEIEELRVMCPTISIESSFEVVNYSDTG